MTAALRAFGALISVLISVVGALVIAEAILRVAAPVPIIPQMYSADPAESWCSATRSRSGWA
jgi:hypothetical protein